MPRQRAFDHSIEFPERSPKAVGFRLWKLRKVRRLNQTDFAARIKLLQTTYSSYEGGARMLSLACASSICDAYGVTLDYLFHGDDSGLALPLAEALRNLSDTR